MWSGLASSLLGGALSIYGSTLGSELTAEYNEDAATTAYERQLELLEKQQDWSEKMSNSAHQREVADLKKAGLNPILSATGGSGASTPVVSATGVQSSSANYGDLGFGKAGDLIGKSSSQGLASAQAKEVKANNKSTRALNDANASSARARAQLDDSQADLNREMINTEKAKQEELRTRSRDNEYTHDNKLGGRLIYEVLDKAVPWLKSKYSKSSAKQNSYTPSRGVVTPISDTVSQ